MKSNDYKVKVNETNAIWNDYLVEPTDKNWDKYIKAKNDELEAQREEIVNENQ